MTRFPAYGKTRGAIPNAVLLLGLLPAFALGGELPAEFSLGAYIPEDVWFYVHHAKNPEREWIDEAWADVFDAAQASGVVGDVASMLLSSMETDDKIQARAGIEKATKLIHSVDWSALTAREYVFAERLASCCVGYEYIFLARGKPGSGESNFRALSAILDEFASMVGGDTKVTKHTIGGIEVRSVPFHVGKLKSLGFSIELFRKGDVLGVATGQKALTDVAALLVGKSQAKPISKNKRFLSAIKNVPTPRDSITFFEVGRFVGDFGSMLGKIPQLESQTGKPHDESTAKNHYVNRKPMRVLQKLIDEADIVDYHITTTSTEGMKEWSRSYTRLQDGGKDKRLAKAVLDRKPFEKFDRFVPANATGFSLSPFVDIEQLYKTITTIAGEIEPSVAAKVANAEAKLAEMGFDIQADLFDWVSGEMISIDLPAAIPTPMSQSDKVLMIRVKNSELAAKKVTRGLNKLVALVQGQGQMLMITPAPVKAEGFKQITHPLFAMLFRPVIGVHEDWLILGTSAGGINACLAVASGDAPSIFTNERFQREGLTPKSGVRSLSYEDTSDYGRDMAQTLTMIGTFGPLGLAGMPEGNPEERELKEMLTHLLGLAARVGPIIQRIDFYSSEASLSVYDGGQIVRSESLVTYKKPSPRPTPPLPPAPAITEKAPSPGS